ncbi:MAG: hypothetical protein QF437_29340 [Planctomycetota bacterium]|jgi:hypothetical protein|nr:hypothetical protein [Planctomycetota bacterium]
MKIEVFEYRKRFFWQILNSRKGVLAKSEPFANRANATRSAKALADKIAKTGDVTVSEVT